MGRKKLDRTKEELREQKRIRDQRYYAKHGDKIRKRNLDRYYKKMGKNMSTMQKN